MTLRTRLDKMAPALTARQRFLAILNAHRAGQPIDHDLRATMPPDQMQEFLAYMRLLTASELLVGNAARTLHEHVVDLQYLVERIAIVERGAAELEQEHPELKRQPGTRRKKGQRGGIPERLRDLAVELQETLVDEITRRWHELRCIERVWDEMTEQLDGADPAHPTARTQASEARASLQALAAGLLKGEALLTEPDQETLESLRTYVREAYDLLGWAEVDPPKGGKR